MDPFRTTSRIEMDRGSSDPYANRRRYERVPFFADLELLDTSTGRRLRGRSINLSRGGIGLFAAISLPVGTHVRISIRLPGPGPGGSVQVGGVVAHFRADEHGVMLGIAFEGLLNTSTQPALCEWLDRQEG